jgi:hypothetical protein
MQQSCGLRSKKTLAIHASVGILFQYNNTNFKEKAALPDKIRCGGLNRLDRFGFLLSINLVSAFQFSPSCDGVVSFKLLL